jgi:hypothetical protein
MLRYFEIELCLVIGYRRIEVKLCTYLQSVECPGRGHRVAPKDQDPVTTDAASYTRRTESSASSLRDHQNSNKQDPYCGIMHSYLKVPHRPLLLEISAYKHVVSGNFYTIFFSEVHFDINIDKARIHTGYYVL